MILSCHDSVCILRWQGVPQKDSLSRRIGRRVGVLNGANQAPDNVRKQRAVSAATPKRRFSFRSGTCGSFVELIDGFG